MILGTACLAAAALDGPSVCAALGRLKLQNALLCAVEGARASALNVVPAVGVRAAWEHRSRGIAAASSVRTDALVLDLPSDMDLEQVCQELFDLGRAQPGLRLSLTTPAEGPLAEPDAMGLALEDVSALGVGWWHVPSRALLAGSDDVLWFERVGRFLRGISLDDVAGGEGGLPPGLGALDLPRLAELTGRAVEATLDTDPIPDPALLSSAVDSLLAAGFR